LDRFPAFGADRRLYGVLRDAWISPVDAIRVHGDEEPGEPSNDGVDCLVLRSSVKISCDESRIHLADSLAVVGDVVEGPHHLNQRLPFPYFRNDSSRKMLSRPMVPLIQAEVRLSGTSWSILRPATCGMELCAKNTQPPLSSSFKSQYAKSFDSQTQNIGN
jgi:hypothetical protein